MTGRVDTRRGFDQPALQIGDRALGDVIGDVIAAIERHLDGGDPPEGEDVATTRSGAELVA